MAKMQRRMPSCQMPLVRLFPVQTRPKTWQQKWRISPGEPLKQTNCCLGLSPVKRAAALQHERHPAGYRWKR